MKTKIILFALMAFAFIPQGGAKTPGVSVVQGSNAVSNDLANSIVNVDQGVHSQSILDVMEVNGPKPEEIEFINSPFMDEVDSSVKTMPEREVLNDDNAQKEEEFHPQDQHLRNEIEVDFYNRLVQRARDLASYAYQTASNLGISREAVSNALSRGLNNAGSYLRQAGQTGINGFARAVVPAAGAFKDYLINIYNRALGRAGELASSAYQGVSNAYNRLGGSREAINNGLSDRDNNQD